MGVPERFWRVMVGTLLLAAVWIQFGYGPGVAAAQQRSNTSDRRPMVLDRAPARMIADPNPVFRAVVLDAEHGEVFMANDKESAGTSVLVPHAVPTHESNPGTAPKNCRS